MFRVHFNALLSSAPVVLSRPGILAQNGRVAGRRRISTYRFQNVGILPKHPCFRKRDPHDYGRDSIPQPQVVREADALAGVRVPPANR
jgi:hypothetical protein